MSAEAPDKQIRSRDDLCRCVGELDAGAVARINQLLNEGLRSPGLDFVDVPLEEVAQLIETDYAIPVVLDSPALHEAGLGAEEPVTIHLNDISLRSALSLMLDTLDLTYLIRDEVLLITTPEEAESDLIVCVYDVRDLLHDNSDKASDALIDTIVSCVATETWAENGGGKSEIRFLKPGLVVISQTRVVHDRICDLLTVIGKLRSAGSDSPRAGAAPPISDEVVTRAYLLQITPAKDAEQLEQLKADVRMLILQSTPEQSWQDPLENGQRAMMAVFPDRVVVRHAATVQDDIEELLRETGIAIPSDERSAGGGFGGGGIFQPRPNPFQGGYGMSRGQPANGNASTPDAANVP